jgi:hypothetical protein
VYGTLRSATALLLVEVLERALDLYEQRHD